MSQSNVVVDPEVEIRQRARFTIATPTRCQRRRIRREAAGLYVPPPPRTVIQPQIIQPVNQEGVAFADLPHDERVAAGHGEEEIITRHMQVSGVEFRDASDDQDKFYGVDTWFKMDGLRDKFHPLQLKTRFAGNDFSYEVLNDVSKSQGVRRGFLGRDYEGQAEFYLCVDTKGTARMARKDEIHALAKRLLEKGSWKDAERSIWRGDDWTLVATNGRGKDSPKLILYIKPRFLHIVGTWHIPELARPQEQAA
jgi:hypothetical protein